MKKYVFLIFLLLMCTMCSSGAEWQDVIDKAHANSTQPSEPQQPSEPEGPSEPKPEMISLGVVTDVHYADKDVSKDRYYRESKTKLEAAVKRFNTESVDMALSLGDRGMR